MFIHPFLEWWAGQPGSAIANLVGLTTVGAILWAWWHTRCKAPFCLRPGKHEVSGTSWKVCANHHTRDWHLKLFHRHSDKHPERLAHGESHDVQQ